MTNVSKQVLFWAPRALSIAFILFISMFALDVFGEGRGFWQTAAALVMHLVPSFVLIAMLALAWRWEWIGVLIPLGLAGLFLWWNYTVRHNAPAAVLIIAGPLFLMAALFLAGWLKRAELHARSRTTTPPSCSGGPA